MKNLMIIILMSIIIMSCEKEKVKVDNYLLGAIEFKSNNYIKAIEFFKKDFKNTKNINSLYRLSEISRLMGDIHNSENYLNKAMKIAPDDPYLINEVALLHKRQGRIDRSLKYFKKLINEKKYIDSTYYHIIDIYVYRMKLNEAEELYKNNKSKIKNKDKIIYLLFTSFFNKEDKRSEIYEKELLESNNVKFLNKLMNFFINNEKIEKSLLVAKSIEKKFPKNIEALKTIALINLKRNHFDIATNYFNKINKLYPNDPRNKLNLVITNIYKSKFKESKQILKTIKNNPEARLLEAFLLYLDKNFEEADKMLIKTKNKLGETLFKKMEFNPIIEFYMINIKLDNEELEEKIKLIDINTGESQELLALKCEKLNDISLYKEVIKISKTIKDENLKNQNLIKQIFIAYLLTKDRELSKKYLEKIKDNYTYKIWFNYFFDRNCTFSDKLNDKYKNDLIYTDIYTDCLIKKHQYEKAKNIILEFVKKNKIQKVNKEYLRNKILIINYNILKQ